jgi:hypothetical protein
VESWAAYAAPVRGSFATRVAQAAVGPATRGACSSWIWAHREQAVLVEALEDLHGCRPRGRGGCRLASRPTLRTEPLGATTLMLPPAAIMVEAVCPVEQLAHQGHGTMFSGAIGLPALPTGAFLFGVSPRSDPRNHHVQQRRVRLAKRAVSEAEVVLSEADGLFDPRSVPRGRPHSYCNPASQPARYLLAMTTRIHRLDRNICTAAVAATSPGSLREHDSELLN